MDLNMNDMRMTYSIPLGPVLHIGASLLQEATKYFNSGFKPVFWFEAYPELAYRAQDVAIHFPENFVIQALLWSHPNLEKSFYLSSNNYESSSLLPMKEHLISYPGITQPKDITLKTSVLDSYSEIKNLREVSLLVIDVQGAEFQVLLGSAETLQKTYAVFVEVSSIEMYAGQTVFSDLDHFMKSQGFKLVCHDLTNKKFMGDALYLNSRKLNTSHYVQPSLPKVSFISFWGPKKTLRRLLLKLGLPTERLTIANFLNRDQ